VVRDAGKVGLGQLITTELAHGKLVSRVEEVLG
jgi:hypothetical protein